MYGLCQMCEYLRKGLPDSSRWLRDRPALYTELPVFLYHLPNTIEQLTCVYVIPMIFKMFIQLAALVVRLDKRARNSFKWDILLVWILAVLMF